MSTLGTNYPQSKGEQMDRENLAAESMKLVASGNPLGAAELFFAEYENSIAAFRKASAAAESSVGMKRAEELTLETIEDSTYTLVDNAMEAIREIVFEAIMKDGDASVLFYERLSDYAKEDVKAFRDFTLKNNPAVLDSEEDVEEVSLDFDSEDLKWLRQQAEAFWTIAGSPEVKLSTLTNQLAEELDVPASEVEVPRSELRTKSLKNGGHSLAFSNARGIGNTEKKSTDSGSNVSNSRLIYTVDGTELPAGTSLSTVGMWYVSSPDWTVSVANIKEAVAEALGTKYSDVGDFEDVAINGHTLSRKRVSA